MDTCLFCNSARVATYSLSGSEISFCNNCKTSGVSHPPSESEISDFYQGFSFQTDFSKYELVATPEMRAWMEGFALRDDAKMLDVGGGGGFFAKAFEEFGLGESTYIDLDSGACEFAKNQVGLERVICDSVENGGKYFQGQKFDFIYCRHVVEHLVNPSHLIMQCAELLTHEGVFIVQCPSGLSKEGLLYPRYWFKFLRKTKVSNDWSWPRSFIFSLTDKHGWGLDPIRHLWAISGDGIKSLFKNQNKYVVNVKGASLADPVYSPYWHPRGCFERVTAKFAKIFCRRFKVGMHLVVEIRKNKNL